MTDQNNSDQFVAPITKIYRQKLKNKAKTPNTQSELIPAAKGSFVDAASGGKNSLGQNIDYSNTQGMKQGFIKKWVNLMRGFRKRYFVLTNEVLIYYKQKKGQVSEKGQISLKLAKIDPKTMNDKRMIIGTGTGEIHLEFNNIKEKVEWLQAIDECKRKLHFQNFASIDGEPLAQSQQYDQEEQKTPQQQIQQVEMKQKAKSSTQLAFQDQRNEGYDEFQMDREVKNALNIALETNILKQDSTLAVSLSETWAAHASFEDALNKFKKELEKISDKVPIELVQLGEQLEQSSNELKRAVTNSIKSVEEAKKRNDINNISYQNHGQMLKDPIFEVNQSQELAEYQLPQNEEEDEDDFYDAKGDELTLQHVQSEIQKFDEGQVVQHTSRDSLDQEYRTMLPALKPPDQKVSVWKVIKDAVGKDLSRFCVPVYFNEPISMVQKVSEIMEYEQLLVKASEEKNPIKRLLYITAFGIAQYKCSDKRLNKPFNPILGETFELKRPNYLYFGEQVSHHPPISACFAHSDSYEFWMNTSMKTSFWGKSLEIKPFGYQNVRLTKTNEHYIIERPNSSVNNLIFGEMYIEHFGQSTVKNLQTGDVCQVEYKKRGWSGKNANEIEGYAYYKGKEKQYKIFGKWNEYLSIQNLSTGEEEQIWVANPMPQDFESMYNFTFFTLQLNYLPPGLLEKLPPTDSRLRPDQRSLENGDLVKAAAEKARLEDKQRITRKEREMSGIEYKPKYFEEYVDPESGEKGYKYVRDYWEDRKKGNWSHLDDLF